MQLFELTKTLFTDPEGWKKIPPGEKKKNHFMVNRMMSINFPLQAQVFNHLKIDPVSTLDSWQSFMRKMYTKVPYWMYTKGQKKRKEDKEKKTNIKESIIIDFAKANKIEIKSVKEALKFFPKEMEQEIKAYEKML